MATGQLPKCRGCGDTSYLCERHYGRPPLDLHQSWFFRRLFVRQIYEKNLKQIHFRQRQNFRRFSERLVYEKSTANRAIVQVGLRLGVALVAETRQWRIWTRSTSISRNSKIYDKSTCTFRSEGVFTQRCYSPTPQTQDLSQICRRFVFRQVDMLLFQVCQPAIGWWCPTIRLRQSSPTNIHWNDLSQTFRRFAYKDSMKILRLIACVEFDCQRRLITVSYKDPPDLPCPQTPY